MNNKIEPERILEDEPVLVIARILGNGQQAKLETEKQVMEETLLHLIC